MEKLMTYRIDPEQVNQTIEEFLKAEGYFRHLIVRLRKTEKGITIGGKPVYTTHRLKTGEQLAVRIAEEMGSGNLVPVPMDLAIVYEDEDLLVVNKAANVPVHPSQGNFDCTLANGMAHYFQEKGELFVYRAVNRLDRDTTGLMILAKNPLSAAVLSRMVINREIHRQYLAVADGCVKQDGTVSAPIARVEGSTIERCVDFERGEYACTHYHVLHYNRDVDCSLLAVGLETGRTHQIRVHMNYLGHPLPGDFLYHPDYRYIGRQALHSHRLEFLHPVTKKELLFEAPLPDDMKFIYSDLL